MREGEQPRERSPYRNIQVHHWNRGIIGGLNNPVFLDPLLPVREEVRGEKHCQLARVQHQLLLFHVNLLVLLNNGLETIGHQQNHLDVLIGDPRVDGLQEGVKDNGELLAGRGRLGLQSSGHGQAKGINDAHTRGDVEGGLELSHISADPRDLKREDHGVELRLLLIRAVLLHHHGPRCGGSLRKILLVSCHHDGRNLLESKGDRIGLRLCRRGRKG